MGSSEEGEKAKVSLRGSLTDPLEDGTCHHHHAKHPARAARRGRMSALGENSCSGCGARESILVYLQKVQLSNSKSGRQVVCVREVSYRSGRRKKNKGLGPCLRCCKAVV